MGTEWRSQGGGEARVICTLPSPSSMARSSLVKTTVHGLPVETTPEGFVQIVLGLRAHGIIVEPAHPAHGKRQAGGTASSQPRSGEIGLTSVAEGLMRLRAAKREVMERFVRANPVGGVRKFLVEELALTLPDPMGGAYAPLYKQTAKRLSQARRRLKIVAPPGQKPTWEQALKEGSIESRITLV